MRGGVPGKRPGAKELKARRDIRLLLAGADVTLVNEGKVFTDETWSVTGGVTVAKTAGRELCRYDRKLEENTSC